VGGVERTVGAERTDGDVLGTERVGVLGAAIRCIDGATVVGRIGCVLNCGVLGVVRRVDEGAVFCLATDREDAVGAVRFTRGVCVVVGRVRVMERAGSARVVGAVQVRLVIVVLRGSLRTVDAAGCPRFVCALAMAVGLEDGVGRSGVRNRDDVEVGAMRCESLRPVMIRELSVPDLEVVGRLPGRPSVLLEEVRELSGTARLMERSRTDGSLRVPETAGDRSTGLEATPEG
jgi:hypothetical protein